MLSTATFFIILTLTTVSLGRPQAGGAPVDTPFTPLLGGNLYAWIFAGPGLTGSVTPNIIPGLSHNIRHVGGAQVQIIPVPVGEVGSEFEGKPEVEAPAPVARLIPIGRMIPGTTMKGHTNRERTMEIARTGLQGTFTTPLGGTLVAGPSFTNNLGESFGTLLPRPVGPAGRQLSYFPSDSNYVYPNTFNYNNGLYTLLPYNYGGTGYPYGTYVNRPVSGSYINPPGSLGL